MHEQIKSLGSKTIVDAALHLNDELRVIPCSNPHSWEDGKEYEEGKDYELQYQCLWSYGQGSQWVNLATLPADELIGKNVKEAWENDDEPQERKRIIASPLSSNDEDGLLYLYDSINGGMESFENEKELRKFIIDNFTEGNEAHPDIDTLKIYKMVGEVSLNEKDELEIHITKKP